MSRRWPHRSATGDLSGVAARLRPTVRQSNAAILMLELTLLHLQSADIPGSLGAPGRSTRTRKRYSVRNLGEAGQLQLRFDGFNIFNHPQFCQPNANLSNAQFGAISILTNTMRQQQAGVKVLF